MYHVRSADGVSLDYTDDLTAALKYGRECRAQVYEVNRITGRATKIL
jgi:hypothetical protein